MADEHLREQVDRAFGGQPDLIVRSPGRVNLTGEHTDYNDGWALPIALDVGTDVAARRRDDRILRVAAPRLAAADEVPVDDPQPRHGPEWTRYVRGSRPTDRLPVVADAAGGDSRTFSCAAPATSSPRTSAYSTPSPPCETAPPTGSASC